MSLTLKQSGGQDYAPHPQGAFAARCVRVIDIGTQRTEFKGEVKNVKKVILAFETSELMSGGEFDGKPFLITNRYTASTSDKSILRKDLKSWRGRDFTEEELQAFHLKNVLNKPCMLNVIHTERNGKVYANIASIMPLPKGMNANKAVSEPYFFDLDDPDMEVFEKLSPKMKELIMDTPEWKAREYAKGEQESANAESIPAEEYDDIPF